MRHRTVMAAIVGVIALASAAQAKECYAPDARSNERAFSRAVTTDGGRSVWLGGQTASNAKADFDAQVKEAFASLDATIKAVGGKGLADMVTMTVFITDNKLGDRFTQLRREIFKECFPASALITVSGLARPGLLVEIQGVAVIDAKK